MKRNHLITSALLALGLISTASAQNYYYITGSTAARGAVYNTLLNPGAVFDGAPAAAPTVVTYGTALGAAQSGATYMAFSGTIGGVASVIETDWSGSEAGITDVSGVGQENFLTAAAIAAGNNVNAPTAAQLALQPVNLAMADNALAFSLTPASTAVQQGPAVVIPFVFVKNNTPGLNTANAPLAIANITSDSFKNLAQGGADLGLLVNAAPTGYNVYLAGRNNQSGTRVNAFGDTGFGIKSTPKQIILTPSGTTAPVTATLFNNGTAGAPVYTTAQGQSSGGTLAKSLGDTSSAADLIADPSGSTLGFYVVAYLGLADAATAENATYQATALTYNGVAYTVAGVQNGAYTFWGNEYVLSKAGSNATVTGIQNNLFNKLSANTSGNEISLATMSVTRSGPTANPVY